MTKSDQYWQKRFELLQESLLQNGDQYYKSLEKQYMLALSGVEKDIRSWYGRLAVNNSMSLLEAKKLLSKEELAEFRWSVEEYIQYGLENSINQQWIKELENASSKVHISRLEALKMQIRQQIEVLYDKQQKGVNDIATSVYTDGYYQTAYEVQKGLETAWSIEKLDNNKITGVISKPWTTDGLTFSDRIWNNKQALVNNIHTELTQALIRGDPPDRMIKRIAKNFNTSKAKAGRLVMTESAFFSSASKKDAFNTLGIKEYEIIATLDMKTSEICQDLDGKVFKMSDYSVGVTAPPFHVWCRSTTAPYFADDYSERFARGSRGEIYHVPSDIKYKEWYNKYVKADQEPVGTGIWKTDDSGCIVPTKIIDGRYSPQLKAVPSSVIQHNAKNQTNRNFYDSNGWLAKQIHGGPHNNKKAHPFGSIGEHAHYWQYEGKKLINREATEIRDEDRRLNKDILR